LEIILSNLNENGSIEVGFEGADAQQAPLKRDDAEYVECLHTSTDCYGIQTSNCHVEFYSHYGFNQPGCTKNSNFLNILSISPFYFLYSQGNVTMSELNFRAFL
jgi:hypothetical protein